MLDTPTTTPKVESATNQGTSQSKVTLGSVTDLEWEQASLVTEKKAKDEVKKMASSARTWPSRLPARSGAWSFSPMFAIAQGMLEQLLTTKNGKPHESILAADLDAKAIHAGLLACGAKAGHPVRFGGEKVEPPTGSIIKISLEYKNKDDKLVRFPAQQWVHSIKSQRPRSGLGLCG